MNQESRKRFSKFMQLAASLRTGLSLGVVLDSVLREQDDYLQDRAKCRFDGLDADDIQHRCPGLFCKKRKNKHN